MIKNIFAFLGVLSNIGGVRKYRKVSDMKETIAGSDAAFGDAINAARNRKLPGSKCNWPNKFYQNESTFQSYSGGV